MARKRKNQSGQAAVETIFMLPIFVLIFVGMYELFSVTFAAQNAHVRAREYLLHNGEYIDNSRRPPQENARMGGIFQGGEYIVADPDIWGVAGSINGGGLKGDFKSRAEDWGVQGIKRGNEAAGGPGAHVEVEMVLCSPFGCPD